LDLRAIALIEANRAPTKSDGDAPAELMNPDRGHSDTHD
jgi:hypothetical protein